MAVAKRREPALRRAIRPRGGLRRARARPVAARRPGQHSSRPRARRALGRAPTVSRESPSVRASARDELVHLRTFDRRTVLDLLTDAGFSVQHIAYDGFLAGRERRFVYATKTGAKLYEWLVTRRYGDLAGVSSIEWRVGRALIDRRRSLRWQASAVGSSTPWSRRSGMWSRTRPADNPPHPPRERCDPLHQRPESHRQPPPQVRERVATAGALRELGGQH